MLVTAFYILAGLCFLLALSLVFHRNPMVAAVSMAGAMICLGVIYTLLHVPFLGVFQVIVYAGAVMVIVLYILMSVGQEELSPPPGTPQLVFTWGAALLLLWHLRQTVVLPAGAGTSQPADEAYGTIQQFGELLVTRYAVPFEVASLLLVGAMVGAVVLSRRRWE